LVSIQLGYQQNLNDPQIQQIIRTNCDVIEGFYFFITNRTFNENFVNDFMNFDSLKQLTFSSDTIKRWLTAELTETLFTKLQKLPFQCLNINSWSRPGLQSIFDNELFTLLEKSETIKCLHLQCLNHYIERWLANTALHNRAEITNFCLSNDRFGYSAAERENRFAPLFHTVADYQLLFPKLKCLCIGICLAEFDDDQLDSMLLCYFQNVSGNIKLHLAVRLYHKLEEIPSERFAWVFAKLRLLQAEIIFINNKRDARITIKSKNGHITTEIIVWFDQYDVKKTSLIDRYKNSPEKRKCIDFNHYGRYSKTCLCVIN
jgi:hypothetical protein